MFTLRIININSKGRSKRFSTWGKLLRYLRKLTLTRAATLVDIYRQGKKIGQHFMTNGKLQKAQLFI